MHLFSLDLCKFKAHRTHSLPKYLIATQCLAMTITCAHLGYHYPISVALQVFLFCSRVSVISFVNEMFMEGKEGCKNNVDAVWN